MFLVSLCAVHHCSCPCENQYPNSDLYRKKFEDHCHFSCQFTAGLIAMNHANFIITSTFQEVAGNKDTVGSTSLTWHSQCLASMVLSMILMSSTPSSTSYPLLPTCPSTSHTPNLSDVENTEHEFVLKDKENPIIFSMARLDRVKNLTGMVELYGRNPRLQELVNLVVVCGDHGKESKDKEAGLVKISLVTVYRRVHV